MSSTSRTGLGRVPNRREIVGRFFARPLRGGRESLRAWCVAAKTGATTMTAYRPASGVAVEQFEDAVYIARLPDGPIIALEGTAAGHMERRRARRLLVRSPIG